MVDWLVLLVACGLAIAALLAGAFRLRSRNAELSDQSAKDRRALEKLRESFSDLVERSYDVHYRHDLRGRIEWMNEGGLRLLGLSQKDLGSLTISDLLEAEQEAVVREEIQRAIAGARVAPRRELLVRTRDGRALWLEIHARIARAGGVPVGIEGVGIDVTARKVSDLQIAIQAKVSVALAEVHSFEGALRALLQMLGQELVWDCGEVWWVDESLDLIRLTASWNGGTQAPASSPLPAPLRTFGRGHGLPGRVWSMGETIAVDDLAADPDPWCGRQVALGEYRRAVGIPIRLSQRVIGVVLLASAGQQLHWAPLPVLDALGGQIGALAEQRRAEEALKVSEARKHAVLETALDCVITVDHEGRVLEFNPAAERAFGYDRDEVLGRHLADLIVPAELRNRHVEAFRDCLETGRRPLDGARVELPAQRRDGSRFAAEISIARIDVGRHPVFTAHVRDISERKMMEKLKDELVATVSHELRTPLASIRGFVELMQHREYEAKERQEFLGIVDKEARRLGTLIDDFLDLQRLEARSHEYRFEPIDLRAPLEQAATVIAAASKEHEVEIDLPETPIWVHADGDRLEQCALNLLSNAVKYSPDGGVVRVQARAEGRNAVVRIQDHGIGMTAETVEKIFNKFFRADTTGTRGIGGTGLGLALVKEIAEAHGGRVDVKSEPGNGSEFRFTLPRVEPEAAARCL